MDESKRYSTLYIHVTQSWEKIIDVIDNDKYWFDPEESGSIIEDKVLASYYFPWSINIFNSVLCCKYEDKSEKVSGGGPQHL